MDWRSMTPEELVEAAARAARRIAREADEVPAIEGAILAALEEVRRDRLEPA